MVEFHTIERSTWEMGKGSQLQHKRHFIKKKKEKNYIKEVFVFAAAKILREGTWVCSIFSYQKGSVILTSQAGRILP